MAETAVAVVRAVDWRHRLALVAFAALSVVLVILVAAGTCRAEHSYPRLANIYFPSLSDADLELLSRWDLLVLAKRAEDWDQAELAQLRVLNPEITLLAHFAVGYNRDYAEPPINADLAAEIEANGWWMLDTSGEPVVFDGGSMMINMTLECPTNAQGQRLCDWLPEYAAERLYEGGRWDGLFLDYCVDRVSWMNRWIDHPIDHDLDGLPADGAELDESWRLGMRECVSKLRDLVGDDYILMTNGNNTQYDYCDGDTRESFPRMHGDWYDNMMNEEHGYLAYEALYRKPTTNIINSIWYGDVAPEGPVRGGEFDREFLLGLTSTLVFGSGYFSCDGPIHSDTWWIEYYDIDLGQPISRAEDVNVLEGTIPPWVDLTELIKKRRFENGIAVINPCLWMVDVPLEGAYYDIHSWNGEFYEFKGLRTAVELSWQTGEVLVGNGIVPEQMSGMGRAVAGRDAVVVSWDPVDGASSYSVYRAKVDSSGSAGLRMLLAVVEEPFYTDGDIVNPSDYRYFVAPIDELRCEGRQSRAIDVSTEPGSDKSVALMVDELGAPPAFREDPSAEQVPPGGPEEFATVLASVWPMPAADRTTVSFTLADAGARGADRSTRLSVYDVSGRLVRRLENGPLEPGHHSREWDLRNESGARVASGCYLVVLEHGGERVSGKALVLR